MTAQLKIGGVTHPLRTLLHSGAGVDLKSEAERPIPQQRRDSVVVASSLRETLIRYKDSVQSDQFRTPACRRQRGEPRANLRDIWEDTRLEALEKLVGYGSTNVDHLASAEEQSVLFEALGQLDRPLRQPIALAGDALLDTVNAPFCAFDYLADKCLEVGVAADLPRKALNSFMDRCSFVSIWQPNRGVCQLAFPGQDLPTIFSIVWDEITRLAKEIAVMAVFGSPLAAAIQRDVQHIRIKYANHPRLEKSCKDLAFQEAQIRAALKPDDL